jgi:hypothetical protein
MALFTGNKGDGKLLPLVIIGLIMVLVFTVSRSKSYISPFSPISLNTNGSLTDALKNFGKNGNTGSYVSTDTSATGNTTRPETPLSQRVTLSSGNSYSERDPNREYISLYVSSNGSPVTISGWKLQSDRVTAGSSQTLQESKSEYVIPQGSVLPDNFGNSAVAPIVLNGGERVIITSGHSPQVYPASLSVSFKTNACTRYFEPGYEFVPSMSAPSCPSPYNEVKGVALEENCITYIEGLWSCKNPTLTDSPKLNLYSNQCREFVNKTFNYKGCVSLHKNDTNFYGNEWRVYLDRTGDLWKKGDTIRLFDTDGTEITHITL